ncbi:MBL fold metallo-hydrolase [Arenivirga flava]|uniref:MBL fold metallo-hydrolase n=1 Tax=Arenivirga flava TaxID=1930060 RepID=A0AA37UBQ1_9MICO|nr:MBL fold metallo-hydrolase [Arenivirga flava]GMA27858.1 MBL fold metallo-hydrolase [Arenivirga flava]
MRVTKREHACQILEKDGRRLVIDPGTFTAPFHVEDVAAVVITHEHPDHWTPEHLERIFAANPEARLYGPAGVVAAAEGFDVGEIEAGDELQSGPFALEFFGAEHAVIHESIPVIDNVGVLVDDAYFYGGDALLPPGRHVRTLAAPAGAPWLKIGDAIDYVLAVRPALVIPVHEAVLSDAGHGFADQRLAWAAEQGGGRYTRLAAGDSLEV